MPEPNQLPQTLLVIDDDIDLLALITEVLNRSGYSVIAVNDVHDALSLCADSQRRIDMVLLDLDACRHNGIELSKKIVEMRPGASLVAMSSDLSKLDAVQIAGGFSLLKSFSVFKLVDIVGNRLRSYPSISESLVASPDKEGGLPMPEVGPRWTRLRLLELKKI